MISKDDVIKAARLAKLELDEAKEVPKFTEQLASILKHVEKLSQLDTSSIEATSHAIDISNVFREDEVRSSGIIDKALASAPEHEDQYFKVPKVI